VKRTVAVIALGLALVGTGAGAGAGSLVRGTVTANPLVVSSSLSADHVDVGGRVTATATIRNLGSQALSGVAATLQLESPGLAVDGDVTRPIPSLAAGGTASVSWQVCGVSPGNYVVVAQATAGSLTAASPGSLLAVRAGAGSCNLQPSTPGCAAGSGTLSTNSHASFAFAADYRRGQPAPTGVVGFKDTAANKSLVSIRLSSLVIAGSRVTIRGDGLATGARVAFRLDADAFGRPGKPDTVAIQWPGYAASGAVTRGGVVIACDPH
jgi:hypothetical protein